jgi:hypothetical protein
MISNRHSDIPSNRNRIKTNNILRDQMEEHVEIAEDFQGTVGGIVHTWKYLPVVAADAATTPDPRDIIAQYYDLERRHCPTKPNRKNFKKIETALPRHYAIVAASRQPRQFCSLTHLQIQEILCLPTQDHITSKARARVHTVRDITPFTQLSMRQKHFMIAHSGLAHLVVKKLAGVFCAKPHTRHAALKRADLIASFISCALACEYLIGNRYYRNLPTILSGESDNFVVGLSKETTFSNASLLTAWDVTPEKIQKTTEELQALYDANIDRLESCVEQYKRGFVSLQSIRTDPEFVKMSCKFWKLNFQTGKAHSLSESRLAAARANTSISYSFLKENAEKMLMCRSIVEGQCRFSRLCRYDVAHLLDNSSMSFMSLLKTLRTTQMRLCNDGITTALLTFAAIEPRMVTSEMAPKLGHTYLACDIASAANHVQTRDPVFGDLLVKHRQHIPRANELYMRWNRCEIMRESQFALERMTRYAPVQSSLDSMRTGERCYEKKNRVYVCRMIR